MTAEYENYEECITACIEHDICSAGSYIPSHNRCFLKSDEHEPPEITHWSTNNSVQSFDFRCNSSFPLESNATKVVNLNGTRSNDTVSDSSGRHLAKQPCFHFDSIYSQSEPLEKVKTSIIFDECLSQCVMNLNCSALSYIEDSKFCLLFSEDRGVLIKTEKSNGNRVISVDLMQSCPLLQNHDKISHELNHDEIQTPSQQSNDNSVKFGNETVPIIPCWYKGSFFPGGLLKTITTRNSGGCVEKCKTMSGCVAMNFNFRTKRCRLLNKSHGPLKITTTKVYSVDFTKNCHKDKNIIEDNRLNSTPEEAKNQNDKSSIHDDRIEHPCIFKGSIYPGGTIMTHHLRKEEACVAKCKTTPGCIATSYVSKTRRCALKGNGHEPILQTEWAMINKVISRDLSNECNKTNTLIPEKNFTHPKNGEAPCLYHNVIINGGTYLSHGAETAEICGEMCLSHPRCSALTFLATQQKCDLKTMSHGPPVHTERAREVSAVSVDYRCDRAAYHKFMTMLPEQRKLRTEDNACKYDQHLLTGPVMEEIDIATEQECVYACETNSECTAFTYNVSSQICYLKGNDRHSPLLSEKHEGIISYDFSMDCVKYKPLEPVQRRNIELCEYPDMNYHCRVMQTISNVKSGHSCVEHCSKNPRCSAVTHIAGPNADKCFLRGKDHGQLYPQVTSPVHKLTSYDLECNTQLSQTSKVNEAENLQTLSQATLSNSTDRNEAVNLLRKDDKTRVVAENEKGDHDQRLITVDDTLNETSISVIVTNSSFKKIEDTVDQSKIEMNLATEKFDFNKTSPMKNRINLSPENPCFLISQSFKDGLLKKEREVMNASDCFKKCSVSPDCSGATFTPYLKYCRLFNWSRSDPIISTYTTVYNIVSYDFKCGGKEEYKGDSGKKDISYDLLSSEIDTFTTNSSSEVSSDAVGDGTSIDFEITEDFLHCLLKNQSFTNGEIKKDRNVTSARYCFDQCSKNINCSASTYSPFIKTCRYFDMGRSGPIKTNYTIRYALTSFDFHCAVKKEHDPTYQEQAQTIPQKVNVFNDPTADVETEPLNHEVVSISVNSMTSTDTNNNSCLFSGQVVTGGLLSVLDNLYSAEECFEGCSIDEECLAANYNPIKKTCRMYDWSFEGPLVTNYAARHELVSYDFKCEGKISKPSNAQDNPLLSKDSPCVLQDKYVIGGLLEMIEPVKSPRSCSEQCDMDDECTIATYLLSDRKCYLHDSSDSVSDKSSILDRIGAQTFDFNCTNKLETNSNITSYADVNASTSHGRKGGCLMKEQMFTGGLTELLSNVSSTEDCFEECAMIPECVVVTYSPKTRKCFLRNSNRRGPIMTEFSKVDGLISFDFVCLGEDRLLSEDATDLCLSEGTIYTGDLLDTLGSVNAAKDCFEECSLYDKCIVATYNPKMSMCFLRGGNLRGPLKTKFAKTGNFSSYDFACKHGQKSNSVQDIPLKVRIPCRFPGQGYSPPVIESISNISQGSDCSEMCAMNENCFIASFHPLDLKCTLGNRSSIGPVETVYAKNAKLITYDYLCDGVAWDQKHSIIKDKKSIAKDYFYVGNNTDTATLISPKGRPYRVLFKKVFLGPSLATYEGVKTPNDCMKICSGEKICSFATFDPKYTNCTLKDVKTRPFTTAFSVWNNVVSFDFNLDEPYKTNFSHYKTNSQQPIIKSEKPCIFNNHQFEGGHLKTLIGIKLPSNCYEECKKERNCVAAVYNSVLLRCGLKNIKRRGPLASLYAKVYKIVSYDLLCNSEVVMNDQLSTLEELDLQDNASINDLISSKSVHKSLQGRLYCSYLKKEFLNPSMSTLDNIQSPNDCLKFCSEQKACIAATYNPELRNCALKGAKANPIATGFAIRNKLVSFEFECGDKNDLQQPKIGVEPSKHQKFSVSKPFQTKQDEPCIMHNKLFQGGLVKTLSGIIYANDCANACEADKNCVVAAFNTVLQRCSLRNANREGPFESLYAHIYKIVTYDFLCDSSLIEIPEIMQNFNAKLKMDPTKDARSSIQKKASSKNLITSKFTKDDKSNDVISLHEKQNNVLEQNTPSKDGRQFYSKYTLTQEPLPKSGDQYPTPTFENSDKDTMPIQLFDTSPLSRLNDEKLVLTPSIEPNKEEMPTLDLDNEKLDRIPSIKPFDEPDVSPTFRSNNNDQDLSLSSQTNDENFNIPSFEPTEKQMPPTPSLEIDNKKLDFVPSFEPVDNLDVSPSYQLNDEKLDRTLSSEDLYPTPLIRLNDEEELPSLNFDNEKLDPIPSIKPTDEEKKTTGQVLDQENTEKESEKPCILHNEMFSGPIIENFLVSSGDECAKKCNEVEGCSTAIYMPKRKRCALKDKNRKGPLKNQWAIDNEVTSYDFLCKADLTYKPSINPTDKGEEPTGQGLTETNKQSIIDIKKPCILRNAIFSGPFITNQFSVSSGDECAEKCREVSNCATAIYMPKENNCGMKNKDRQGPYKTQKAIEDKIVSYDFLCNSDHSPESSVLPEDKEEKPTGQGLTVKNTQSIKDIKKPCILQNATFSGPYITKQFSVSSGDECAEKCREVANCATAIYMSKENNCGLKNKDRQGPYKTRKAIEDKIVSYDFLCNSNHSPESSVLPEDKKEKPTGQGLAQKNRQLKAMGERSTTQSRFKPKESCILNNNVYNGQYISAKPGYKHGDECKEACANTPACLVATFIASIGKCYLRGEGHGEPESSTWAVDNRAISYDFTCSTEPSPYPVETESVISDGDVCYHKNAFFPNGTIEIIDDVKTVSDCGKMCESDGNCVAFNYVIIEQACTLKSSARGNAISTPWAVRNQAYAFVLDLCNDEDFVTASKKLSG